MQWLSIVLVGLAVFGAHLDGPCGPGSIDDVHQLTAVSAGTLAPLSCSISRGDVRSTVASRSPTCFQAFIMPCEVCGSSNTVQTCHGAHLLAPSGTLQADRIRLQIRSSRGVFRCSSARSLRTPSRRYCDERAPRKHGHFEACHRHDRFDGRRPSGRELLRTALGTIRTEHDKKHSRRNSARADYGPHGA